MTDLSIRGDLPVRETRAFPFTGTELREVPDGAGGTMCRFEGYACITEKPYEMQEMFGVYTEVVRRGAFGKTLAEGADVAFLVNHEGLTLARTKSGTLRLAEDDQGLNVEADLDPTSPLVQNLRSAMTRGDVDEMSFAFRCTRQEWSPDWMQRDVLEVSIHKGDVSAVNYGANPNTVAAMRHRMPTGVTFRTVTLALQELRAGAVLSAATMAVLQQVLDLVADADDNVDSAQEILADLMGVPNPDTPEVESEPQANALALARVEAHRLRFSAA